MNVGRVWPWAAVLLAVLVAFGWWLGRGRFPAQAPTPRSVPVTQAPSPPSFPVISRRATGERTLFDLTDPAGDDRGAGSYRYPADPSFLPGTFDLRRFRVSVDAESVHFRCTFGAMPNPWGAPEGFGYQRIDIYLHTGSGQAQTKPVRPGANIRFIPRYGWDRLVRCAPWGGSRVEKAGAAKADEAGTVKTEGAGLVKAEREGDATIHLTVPKAALGEPSRRWRYYVLVGGYDAFGPDEYRPVTAAGGRWVFGGGDDGNEDPNVVDLLTPRFTLHSQSRQLRRPEKGGLPELYPVGGR